MGGLSQYWVQGDNIGRAVAIMLLLMSISAWVVIFWKGWLLNRARRDLTDGAQAFWRSADLAAARETLKNLDREAVLLPLVDAASQAVASGTLEAQALPEAQLTRRLRDSLHAVLARLQRGQVLLASVGAVSPFVGLFGTVWGIYHAMMGIAVEGSASLDKVAGPVGEALIMTAAGLAVAIPAVLAYNIFGKMVSACEADLEGFAHDLRETLLASAARGH
ncbi:MAG: MotA/TolQ/ExbB proton channel family protein [Aquabacterium sp.]|uniref:MotA/TolQ/ExbB proton channel family protein n=1 Tax=Aquabacterium sp. TaxID=1872578 RepID=UPI0025BAB842|nr:MotA/TolQ/ExbB proton channel family protein [Aquabacterium sp.]MBI5926013.1 MotA/TolQ/ExbB proton channel family protein [Aquabacterium sp.]